VLSFSASEKHPSTLVGGTDRSLEERTILPQYAAKSQKMERENRYSAHIVSTETEPDESNAKHLVIA